MGLKSMDVKEALISGNIREGVKVSYINSLNIVLSATIAEVTISGYCLDNGDYVPISSLVCVHIS